MTYNVIIFSVLFVVASGASLYDTPHMDGYGQTRSTFSPPKMASGYGEPTETRTKRVCTPVFNDVTDRHCEDYNERICRTVHNENCVDVPDKQCRAVVSTKPVRKCFNVTERLCELKEEVKFQVVQVRSAVQKCRKVQERVCDTVYMLQSSNNEDVQCRAVSNNVCTNEERTIFDKTCKTTTTFDCKVSSQETTDSNFDSQSFDLDGSSFGDDQFGSSGRDSFASGDSLSLSSGDSFGSDNEDSFVSSDNSQFFSDSNGRDSFDASSDENNFSNTEGSYGSYAPPPKVQKVSKPVCQRKVDTKCYNTPRTVSVVSCRPQTENVCKNFDVSVPFTQEKKNCRNQEKKVCVLEHVNQPKQVKKYSYTKQCRPVPRKLCGNTEINALVPSCSSTSHQKCSYTPVEKCENVPKKHCFNTTRRVRKEKCEMVQEKVQQEQGY